MTSSRLHALRAHLVAAATLAVGISACASEVSEQKKDGEGGGGTGGGTSDTTATTATTTNGQGGDATTTTTTTTGGEGGLGPVTSGQGGFGGFAEPDPVLSCYVPELPGECAAVEDASVYLPPQACSNAVVISGPELVDGSCCYMVEAGDPSNCAAGRPFVVDGTPRRASLAAGPSAWSSADHAAAAVRVIERAQLPASVRAGLADAWALDALAEHASVAAFAHHALELLAVGAPPHLVADAHRAAIDEIEHARAAFAVASAYAGTGLAPGAIDIRGVGSPGDLAELAAAAAAEGCVEEALAAAVIEERAAHCEVGEIAALLRAIGDDEARHAAHAYRFVAWAILRGGSRVRDAVVRSIDEASRNVLASFRVDAPVENEAELAREGVLSGRRLAEARRRGWNDVVRPALAALLGPDSTSLHA